MAITTLYNYKLENKHTIYQSFHYSNWGDKLFKCILLIIWEFFSYLYFVIVQTAGK